ncbi:RNA polymerase sigma factor [Anseongella ginsenosidimutans]|nr:RNA polymerase sigma factor [Anseongella ginsenosidimutans]
MLMDNLVKGCLEQNRSSQKALYRQYFGYSMSICLRYAPNREEAVEIVNDGFMKVFTRIGTYDPKRSFKSWLGRIMVNSSIDHYRAAHKHYHHDGLDSALEAEFPVSVIDKLSYDELIGLVQQLPSSYRTVFNLHVIDGYKHEEIADMLSISVGTSKSNLFKARESLKLKIRQQLRPVSPGRPDRMMITSIKLKNG